MKSRTYSLQDTLEYQINGGGGGYVFLFFEIFLTPRELFEPPRLLIFGFEHF